MLASPSTSGQLSQFGASLYGQQSKNPLLDYILFYAKYVLVSCSLDREHEYGFVF